MKDAAINKVYLSAREAAAALGVSQATLYAYVSRGMIRSEPVPGSKAKRYRAEDVRRLRDRRAPFERPATTGALTSGSTGPWLEDPLVLDSAVTLIAEERLFYRGVEAVALAEHAGLEHTACHLWDVARRDPFAGVPEASVGPSLSRLLQALEGLSPLDRILSVLPAAAQEDEGAYNRTKAGLVLSGARIMVLSTAIAGGRPEEPLRGRPLHRYLADVWGVPQAEDLIRRALVLCADHELNPSTFTLRCAVSTGAGLYEGVAAALCAMKGPRHGAASDRAARLLASLGDAPEQALRERARLGEDLPGFGHPLYPSGDPRAEHLLGALEEQNPEAGAWAREVAHHAWSVGGRLPNVDFALAVLAKAFDLPRQAGVVLFTVARTAGWVAHAIEQAQLTGLIRPRARYVGPAPKGLEEGVP